jgi:hypothetical protein
VILPIAYGVAIAAVLLLMWHVARRYPSAPKRIPLRIGIDGRPSKRFGPKAVLWLAPGILAATLVILGVALRLDPPKSDVHMVLAFVFLTIAEVAWYAAWIIDRQIELARKMTYRIAPMRTLRVSLPLLVTVAVVVVLGLRAG